MPVWYWAIFAILAVAWFVLSVASVMDWFDSIGQSDEKQSAIIALVVLLGGLVVVFLWPVAIPVALIIGLCFLIKSAIQ